MNAQVDRIKCLIGLINYRLRCFSNRCGWLSTKPRWRKRPTPALPIFLNSPRLPATKPTKWPKNWPTCYRHRSGLNGRVAVVVVVVVNVVAAGNGPPCWTWVDCRPTPSTLGLQPPIRRPLRQLNSGRCTATKTTDCWTTVSPLKDWPSHWSALEHLPDTGKLQPAHQHLV